MCTDFVTTGTYGKKNKTKFVARILYSVNRLCLAIKFCEMFSLTQDNIPLKAQTGWVKVCVLFQEVTYHMMSQRGPDKVVLK